VPAVGAVGPIFVIERSARVDTVAVTLAVLLPGTGSAVVDAAVTAFVNGDPFAVLARTCTVSVKSADAVASEQPHRGIVMRRSPTTGRHAVQCLSRSGHPLSIR
jgi:hypothetical protein